MAGCGVKAGAVVGATNALGTDVKDKGHDIGAVFHTWFKALGIDSKKWNTTTTANRCRSPTTTWKPSRKRWRNVELRIPNVE